MTRLPRLRELNIIIDKESRPYFQLQYDDRTHNIILPNMSRFLVTLKRKPQEFDIVMKFLIDSLTHEFFHKWLHENIGFKAMLMWDFLDKKRFEEIEYYSLSCL